MDAIRIVLGGLVIIGLALTGSLWAPSAWSQSEAECDPAETGGYAPDECSATVSDSEVESDGTVIVSGTGFMPGSEVELVLRSDPISLGSVTTDADGSFTKRVRIPASASPGRHTITATGVDRSGAPRVLSVVVTVVRTADATPSAAPPRTGADPAPWVVGGVALLVAGGGGLILARRRRSPAVGGGETERS